MAKTTPDVQATRTKALRYSRDLPTRQFSPHGALGLDENAIADTFRECYEAFLHLGKSPPPATVRRGNSNSWIGTHIELLDAGTSTSGATRVWDVASKEGSIQLGQVKWFAQWRKYAFFPAAGTVFEQDCLRELAQFLVDRTADHRRA